MIWLDPREFTTIDAQEVRRRFDAFTKSIGVEEFIYPELEAIIEFINNDANRYEDRQGMLMGLPYCVVEIMKELQAALNSRAAM